MPDPPDPRSPVSTLIGFPRPPGVPSLAEVERGVIRAMRYRHDAGLCGDGPATCPACEFGKSLAGGGPRR